MATPPHSNLQSTSKYSPTLGPVGRKSAYIVSVVSPSTFVRHGAITLDFQGLYYVKKDYSPCNPLQETNALLGIPIPLIHHFYTETSPFVTALGSLKALEFVQDASKLCCTKTCETLQKFHEFFQHSDQSWLVLLNIEPQGDGKYKRWYPNPRTTLPGGSMEDCDCGDYFETAKREFEEETGVTITSYTMVSQKKVVKELFRQNNKHYVQFHAPVKVVSVFFALRLT